LVICEIYLYKSAENALWFNHQWMILPCHLYAFLKEKTGSCHLMCIWWPILTFQVHEYDVNFHFW